MDNSLFGRTCAKIDIDALRSNFKALRRQIKTETKIMAVVKADAYGHGVENIAGALQNEGADWFAVSSLFEAKQLRRLGITRPVLVLGYTAAKYACELAENSVTQAVFSGKYAAELSRCATDAGVTVDVHIKTDTGMSRLGFDAREKGCAEEIARVCSFGGLNATGIFTHFPSADYDGDPDAKYTRESFALFTDCIKQLSEMGVDFKLRHCCNSAAALCDPDMQLDMVREGIMLYGLWPSEETVRSIGLKPVMQLKTVVTMVKTLPAGRTVSYGRTHTLSRETTIATVCIGYADGYPRSLSGKGEMLVKEKRAPVIGRVCMDQLMLDVTDIPDVREGDEVTVFGTDKEAFLPVDEIARKAATINYELICMVSRRVPRLYFEDGRIIAVTDHLQG